MASLPLFFPSELAWDLPLTEKYVESSFCFSVCFAFWGIQSLCTFLWHHSIFFRIPFLQGLYSYVARPETFSLTVCFQGPLTRSGFFHQTSAVYSLLADDRVCKVLQRWKSWKQLKFQVKRHVPFFSWGSSATSQGNTHEGALVKCSVTYVTHHDTRLG